MEKIDFKLTESKGGFIVTPLTDNAKKAVKKHKGVLMRKFFMPNSLIDGFLTMANLQFNANTTEY